MVYVKILNSCFGWFFFFYCNFENWFFNHPDQYLGFSCSKISASTILIYIFKSRLLWLITVLSQRYELTPLLEKKEFNISLLPRTNKNLAILVPKFIIKKRYKYYKIFFFSRSELKWQFYSNYVLKYSSILPWS